jgi:hypothetical protein
MLNLEGLAHPTYIRKMNDETLADRPYVLAGNFADLFAVP